MLSTFESEDFRIFVSNIYKRKKAWKGFYNLGTRAQTTPLFKTQNFDCMKTYTLR